MISSRPLFAVRSLATSKWTQGPRLSHGSRLSHGLKAVYKVYDPYHGQFQTAAFTVNHFYAPPVKVASRVTPAHEKLETSLEDRSRTSMSLSQTINTSSAVRLKRTMHELCHSRPEVAEAVSDLLLAQELDDEDESDDDEEDEEDEEEDEDEDEDESDTGAISARSHGTNKAKPGPQLTQCFHCEELFDAGECGNDHGCVYHDGHLEFNELAVADHDERRHGPLDTEENRRDFPEKLVWTCCKGDSRSEGCQVGNHEKC